MNLLRGTSQLNRISNPTIATVGNFDGLHLGHQEIIQYVVTTAKQHNFSSVLISFEPSPNEFFLKENAPARIYSWRDKFEVTKSLQIDHYVCLNFNAALANLSATDFVSNILVRNLNIKKLVIGDNFRFGHNRTGDIQLLRNMGSKLGFEIEDKDTIVQAETRVSSSLIREKLAEGEFEQAESLLGRPFEISGRVFHGEKKGRELGFPTAYILLQRRVSPIRGVFIVTATCNDQTWNGVANIGKKPTVNGQREQLEVHLFGCAQNLYGQRLKVKFLAKLRNEQKFSSLDTLKHQISLDVQQAKQYFESRAD